jgi:hypothetical protein
MRPGPRTTVLTTDVRTAMRRPASVWEYADGLPPELAGRPAAAPRQALARPALPQPVSPSAAVTTSAVPSGKVQAAAGPAPKAKPVELAAVRRPAQGAEARAVASLAPRQQAAPVEAERKVSAAEPLPAAAERQASQTAGAPRPLALLDRAPAPAPQQASLARNALHVAQVQAPLPARGEQPVAAPAASLARSDERKKPNPLPQTQYDTSIPENGLGTQAASTPAQTSASLVLVSVPASEASAGTMLADASGGDGTGTSLRDRIPRPAF